MLAIGCHGLVVHMILHASQQLATLHRYVRAQLLPQPLAVPHEPGADTEVVRLQHLVVKLGLCALRAELFVVLVEAVVDPAAPWLHVLAVPLHVTLALIEDPRRQLDVLGALAHVARQRLFAAFYRHVQVVLLEASQGLAPPLVHRVLAHPLHLRLAVLRDPELQAPIVVARLQVIQNGLLAPRREVTLHTVVLQALVHLRPTRRDVLAELTHRMLASVEEPGLQRDVGGLQGSL
mmetsp:Transcript_90954/g.229271  ORF Transcript_90954/g.229271 Transcript_90954/m.229271 type:complete len:235 (-) Transcript_90954:1085-1789(-)